MEHSLHTVDLARPWRTATLVATTLAAIELVALVGLGIVLVGRPLSRHAESVVEAKAVARVRPAVRPAPVSAELPRSQTSVLVLNGNGRTGAAADEATRVRARGYVVGGTGDASRSDYTRSVVMYRPGYAAEARRLARDLRIRLVGPLDGLRVGDLMGAHLALVVGT